MLSVNALQTSPSVKENLSSTCLSDCINGKYGQLFLGNITMGEKINFEENLSVDKITPSLYYKRKKGNSKYAGEMSQKKMAMLAQQNVW